MIPNNGSGTYGAFYKTTCIAASLEEFSGVDSAKREISVKKNYEVRIDFFGVFVIFADFTIKWWSAIDFFFYKEIKKKLKICTCS